MTTRIAAVRRDEEKVANTGVPPEDNQAPFQEQVHLGGQAVANPPIILYGEIREDYLNLNQVMATQAQVVTTQDQVMMTQANQEVALCVNQNTSTMD